VPQGFPPQPVFPFAIDSNGTLFLVNNTTESRLTADNQAWSDTVPIAPVAADADEIWPDNGFATISGEILYYDSVELDDNDKVKTLKNCVRNLGGVHTQFNLAGTDVRGFVMAEHHNQLVEATLRIEQFVGTNFTEDQSTLDWRIRNLQAQNVLFDDFSCVDVVFTFVTISTDPASGTVVNFTVQLTGDYNSYRLDFGDGSFTESLLSGTHTYAPNTIIDPVVTVSNNRCTVAQTPPVRLTPTEPAEINTITEFFVPVCEVPDIPPLILPEINPPTVQIGFPPLVIPCVNVSPIGPIDIPSIVTFEPAINIPSLIEFGPISIPSEIVIIGGVDLPSEITITGPEIPTAIVIEGGVIPTVITVEAGVIPTVITIEGVEIPTSIDVYDDIPSVIEVTDDVPSVIEVISNIPTTITVYHNIPTTINVYANIPTTINVYGSFPTSINVYGSFPTSILAYNVDIPTSILAYNVNIPTSILAYNVNIPTSILGYNINIPTSIFAYNANVPTVIDVNWNPVPVLSCVVTVSCGSTSVTPMAMMSGGFEESFVDSFQSDPPLVTAQDIGIPSEIKVVVPEIPDMRLVHDLPMFIEVRGTTLPTYIEIKAETPIPNEISLKHNLPEFFELRATNVPEFIFLKNKDVPEFIELRMAEDVPRKLMMELVGVPESIQLVGAPTAIHLVSNVPTAIHLVLPEKPEVEMVYRGDPITHKVELDMSKLLSDDEGEGQCVRFVPCRR
jgi:PKD repeat protein